MGVLLSTATEPVMIFFFQIFNEIVSIDAGNYHFFPNTHIPRHMFTCIVHIYICKRECKKMVMPQTDM